MKVFVYGTLMNEKIRSKVIGRYITGVQSTVHGYDGTKSVTIENESFPAAEKNSESSINGITIEITKEELEKLDLYETNAYMRKEIKLSDGTTAWIYLKNIK